MVASRGLRQFEGRVLFDGYFLVYLYCTGGNPSDHFHRPKEQKKKKVPSDVWRLSNGLPSLLQRLSLSLIKQDDAGRQAGLSDKGYDIMSPTLG